jgi:predicted RNase H-like HicB family nuclease
MSQGETLKEAKQNLSNALKEILEYRHEQAKKELIKLRAKKIPVRQEKITLAI